uniref:VWFA domain-containing protein n=1 Tax=Myripristis murdjan TaxID=586833 RepID=A0A667Z7S4_9TELE
MLTLLRSWKTSPHLAEPVCELTDAALPSLPVCTQEAVADIVFLVDGSWSIGTKNFEQVRQFLYTLVNSFDVGPNHVRIGLVQYSNTPRTEFLLNTYQSKEDILQYISNLPYKGGGTQTGLGLDFMLTEHFVEGAGSRARYGVPQIAVVITDGQSQDNVEPHAQQLKSRGIILYAIGIKDADEAQLREIANEPHDQYVYSVSDFAALQGLSQSVIQTLCTAVEEAKRQLLLSAQGNMACFLIWLATLDLLPSTIIHFRSFHYLKWIKLNYLSTVADIVFLVDGSSSIGIDNFQEVRQFLRKFIEGLDIGADKVRVGLAQYSNEPHQEFLLKDHMDKQSLLAQVDNLPYRTGGTATGKAISFLETQYFTAQAGSRADQRVPQIAIVITDGDSEDDVIAPAQQLRKQGVIIFGIGVGAANMMELQGVTNRPHERFLFSIDNYQALAASAKICNIKSDYTLSDCKSAKLADIVFIVDESGSITTPNFQLIRSFLHKIVDGLDVNPKRVRVGIITYNDRPTGQVYLNTFNDKSETLQFIKILPYRGGGTNTGAALRFARERVFIKEKGSRKSQGVQQVAVVITDGKSQDAVSQEAADLRRAGVTVYAVGIKDANKTELEQMASYPSKKHVFIVDSFAKLKTLEQSLQKILCYNIIRQAITINTRRTGIKEVNFPELFLLYLVCIFNSKRRKFALFSLKWKQLQHHFYSVQSK